MPAEACAATRARLLQRLERLGREISLVKEELALLEQAAAPFVTEESWLPIESPDVTDAAEMEESSNAENPQPGELLGWESQTMTRTPKGFSYIPGFLTDEEQCVLLRELEHLVEYRHDVFRGQRLKRAQANFGYTYVAIGRKLDPAPAFPIWLRTIVEKAVPYCPQGTQFDQCIATRYPTGAGVGWHKDAPRFGDCIAGVSLGTDARLQFRRNGNGGGVYEVRVDPGSFYVMTGPARWEFQHRVVPVKAQRHSLTLREVPEATPGPNDRDDDLGGRKSESEFREEWRQP